MLGSAVVGGTCSVMVAVSLAVLAQPLGEAWFFIPSATPGRVWLALLDRISPATARALRGVREVTVDGETTLAHSARPPHWPLAAVDDGLLVQGNTLELWQPTSGRILRKLPASSRLPRTTRSPSRASHAAPRYT